LRYASAKQMHDDLLNLLDDAARARLGVTGEYPLPPISARLTRAPDTITAGARSIAGTSITRPRRWRLPVAVAGALAILAVGLVLWAPWKSGSGEALEPEPVVAAGAADASPTPNPPPVVPAAVAAAALDAGSTPPAPQDAGSGAGQEPEAAPAAAADVAGPETRAPDGSSVAISLQNVPDKAEVFWDGAKVDTLPFRVAKADVARRLEVQAQGYEPFIRMITPDQDVAVALDMQRTGRTVVTRPPRDAGTAPGPTAPGPTVTEPVTPRQRDAGLQQGGRGTSISTGFE
jgi:hypothetical protein